MSERYSVIEFESGEFPWAVVDRLKEVKVCGWVTKKGAEGCADRLNHFDRISCCATSLTSHGWHHDPTCENWVTTD